MTLDPNIFRAYDVRGIVGTQITEHTARLLGYGFARSLPEHSDVLVGCDARDSSKALLKALIDGLRAGGSDVIDLGLVPTPLVHYAGEHLAVPHRAVVTASHNPKGYNGFKLFRDGRPLAGEQLQTLAATLSSNNELDDLHGDYREHDIKPMYLMELSAHVQCAKPLKIALECFNGASAVIAGTLFKQQGCEVITLHGEASGDFPFTSPDPSQQHNLTDLKHSVVEAQCDLGFAFDGDGDRISAVDELGEVIFADELFAALAVQTLQHQPLQTFVYDVKSSVQLAQLIQQHHGRAIACASGHTHLRKAMSEHKALMGGEYSGHIFLKDRWYGYDDAHYVALRLLSLLSTCDDSASQCLRPFTKSFQSPEYLIPMAENAAPKFMRRFLAETDWPEGNSIRIDGLRQEFEDGWLLIRASNTTPSLSIRFEAHTQERLQQLQSQLRTAIMHIDSTIDLPF